MNIKAEKIEQIVQVINRNLLLVFSGQISGLVPLESRQLQKVDAVIFGHDSFAYEMVHFVKSSNTESSSKGKSKIHDLNSFTSNNNDMLEDGSSRQELWEQNFVEGLETLLVECAMVADDIERDCFVSRVYCWFTEKLAERRELPKKARGIAELKELKNSLRAMKLTDSHTMRALEQRQSVSSAKAHHLSLLNDPSAAIVDMKTVEEFPTLNIPEKKSKYGSRNIPVYVKNGLPEVLVNRPDHKTFLPKIPGAEDNYGMIYNQPETEAEKNMNELWMARRRQEAFEWKTQQHLALVMDRLALHKSRLETDALRRQESSVLLKARAKTAEDVIVDRFGRTIPGGANGRNHRSSPNSRQRSRRRRNMSGSADSTSVGSNDDSQLSSPERTTTNNTNTFSNTKTSLSKGGEGNVNLHITGGSVEMELSISRPGRIGVMKQSPQSVKREHVPMKFKTELHGTFAEAQQQQYMQLSDSDDDDKPDRGVTNKPAHAAHGGARKKGGAAASKTAGPVHFKHDKPVIRERPQSAKLFRAIAMDDPELKVHYRHSNFRRMPMTLLQEKWVEDVEAARVKRAEELSKKLFDDRAAKAVAQKGKGDKPDKGGDGKKDKKKNEKDATKQADEKPKSIYKSAEHFMTTHFPDFEGDDEMEAIGPMRNVQLLEVANIIESCQESGVNIRESTLRKALMIPQDRPEAICLEGLKTETEGLMVNPLAKEFWRQMKMGGKKGKRKKKKKA
mmetsp:Transcript_15665/g.21440  ORF Transcript_15665/g.21440 Transcript_15665/m.21440 type:complete len:733 (+) Transcript_15665:63-2261(+)